MPEGNVIQLHKTNKVLERLDMRIVSAIKETAAEHPLTAAEVAGVMRAIELRLFLKEPLDVPGDR